MNGERTEHLSRTAGLYGLSVMMLAAGGLWPAVGPAHAADNDPLAEKVGDRTDAKSAVDGSKGAFGQDGSGSPEEGSEEAPVLETAPDLWTQTGTKRRPGVLRSRLAGEPERGDLTWPRAPGQASAGGLLAGRPEVEPVGGETHGPRSGEGHFNSRERLTDVSAHGPPVAQAAEGPCARG